MKAIVTSDIHLSDRPADAYRFELFAWLRQQCQQHEAEALLILGDLTENKDRHSAALVNRTVDELLACAQVSSTIVIRGNHDGTDPAHPFFGFMDGFEALRFASKPRRLTLPGGNILLLPHSRNPTEDWAKEKLSADYIFLHQTFKGARAENGEVLEGMSTADIKPRLLAVSGDIHVPQQIGPVIYCGAPYHIKFGDSFEPRVLLIDDKKTRDLHFPAPRKLTVSVSTVAELEKVLDKTAKGDQARLTLTLRKRDFEDWSKVRREAIDTARAAGVQLFGVEVQQAEAPRANARKAAAAKRTPTQILEDFAQRHNLTDAVRKAGLRIVEG